MSANQLTLWYLVASICFILALKGLSSPTTARRGNAFGMAGMTIAVLTTIAGPSPARLCSHRVFRIGVMEGGQALLLTTLKIQSGPLE